MKLWLVLVCTFGIFVQFAESKEVQGVSCSTRQSVLGDSLISKTDMTLKGHVRKTLEKITFIQCSLRCLKEDWCISVNFQIQKKMGKCELNDYGVEDETSVSIEKGEFEKKEGFVYTQLRPAGSGCHDNTCHNGGSCVIDCIQWQSQCYCLSGFRGDRCEEPNTGCSSNPCLYGGTCTDQVNGYSCTCAVGYNGTRCENNIDECSSNPCQNGGTCTDQVNGYSCTCAAGYNGTRCENNCDLHFPTARTSNSIIIDAAFQTQLSEFTVSFWLKVSNEEVIFYPLSYATQSTPAAFVIGIKDDGIAEITVRGETKALDSGVKRDNTWQHCAITWKSSSGRVRFYHQGSKTASKNGLKRRETIPHGGKMVIGQYQGSYGGGYDSSKLMLGYLADLNIWSSELTSSAINSLSSKCFMSTSAAPVLSWSTIISKPLGGQLSKTCPATCLS